jgi:predicted ATPase
MALGGGDVAAAATVVAAIRERALDRRAPVVVAIDGRSGAGKSTLAAGVAAYYVRLSTARSEECNRTERATTTSPANGTVPRLRLRRSGPARAEGAAPGCDSPANC